MIVMILFLKLVKFFITGSNCVFFLTGAVTCTDVDMHKIVSGSNDRTVKVMIFSAFSNC